MFQFHNYDETMQSTNYTLYAYYIFIRMSHDHNITLFEILMKYLFMHKALFSTQKGTRHTMRNKKLLNNSSFCFDQARHLSKRVNYHHLSIFSDSSPFYGVRAPASAAVTGAAKRAPSSASVSQRARARV